VGEEGDYPMALLDDAGLRDFYDRDVWGLNDLLIQMGQRGMPIDEDVRRTAALELDAERTEVLAQIQSLMPTVCHPVKIYKKKPKEQPHQY